MPTKPRLKRDVPEPLPADKDGKEPTWQMLWRINRDLSRRMFLRRAMGSAAARCSSVCSGRLLVAAPSVGRQQRRQDARSGLQRGGNDGLNTIVPTPTRNTTSTARATNGESALFLRLGRWIRLDLPALASPCPVDSAISESVCHGVLAIVTRAATSLYSVTLHRSRHDERGVFSMRRLVEPISAGSPSCRLCQSPCRRIRRDSPIRYVGRSCAPSTHPQYEFCRLNSASSLESNLRAMLRKT